jgi:hypothetical protein
MHIHSTNQYLVHTLLVVTMAGTALGAQAAGRDNNDSAIPGQKNHCVTRLEPITKGQKTSVATEIGCFATFAAATSAATDGVVTLAADATPDSISEAAIAPSASVLIGIDYDRRGFGGASRSWYVANRFGCFGGRAYSARMPGFLNNRLSSTVNYGGCGHNWSYDSADLTRSDWFVCFGRCSYVGSLMDNRASFKVWER